MKTIISVFYNSSTNGCHISSEGHPVGEHQPHIDAESDIIDWADSKCTDSGEFYGDKNALIHHIAVVVAEHLGPDVQTSIEISE